MHVKSYLSFNIYQHTCPYCRLIYMPLAVLLLKLDKNWCSYLWDANIIFYLFAKQNFIYSLIVWICIFWCVELFCPLVVVFITESTETARSIHSVALRWLCTTLPFCCLNFLFVSVGFSVTYLQCNPGGLTIFGWTVDRALINTIFFVEMSLVLFVLGKTVAFTSKWICLKIEVTNF